MRRTILLLAVAVLALMMAAPARATRGQPTKELPFRATLDGITTSQVFAPGFPSVRSTFEGRCSVPSDWLISFEGSGHATHLGRLSWSSSHCTQFDLATGTGTFSDGHLRYVAANGDFLDADYGDGGFSPMSPTMVCFFDVWTITGGTGRFVGASGSGEDRGCQEIVNGVPGPLRITEVGTIVFDASHRAR